MARTPKQQEKPEPEDAIMKRMNKALKKMMSTPHETQKEMIARRRMIGGKPETHEKMVERKHRRGEIKPRKKIV